MLESNPVFQEADPVLDLVDAMNSDEGPSARGSG